MATRKELEHRIERLEKSSDELFDFIGKLMERLDKVEKVIGNEFMNDGIYKEICKTIGFEPKVHSISDRFYAMDKSQRSLEDYLGIRKLTTPEKTEFVKKAAKK